MATRKDVRLFITKRLKEMKEEEEEEKKEEENDKEDSPSPVENKFVNDGSFLELFKKKMAKQKKESDSKETLSATQTEKEDGETQLKAYQAGGVGQRKSLLKTMKLREQRKRRREEIEAEQKREEAEDNNQSVAWKTYMREVKELQDKCCSEKEDHRRPLVK